MKQEHLNFILIKRALYRDGGKLYNLCSTETVFIIFSEQRGTDKDFDISNKKNVGSTHFDEVFMASYN